MRDRPGRRRRPASGPSSADSERPELLCSLDAEKALLGACLIENKLIDSVIDRLQQGDFYEPLHGRIWAAMIRRRARGEAATPATMAQEFAADPAMAELVALGGASYLLRLTEDGGVVLVARDCAKQVAELARLRLLRDQIEVAAHDLGARPVEEVVSELEAALWSVSDQEAPPTESQGGNTVRKALTRSRDLRDSGDQHRLKCLLIPELDEITGGLEAQQLIIVAGRPGAGKSALLGSAVLGYALNGHGAAFVSLEMGEVDLGTRMAADMTFDTGFKIPHSQIRNGRLTDTQFSHLDQQAAMIDAKPLWIVETAGLTIGKLDAMVRRLKRMTEAKGSKLEVVVVDYLQLLRAPDAENRLQEVSSISRGLKELAKRHHICILAAAQLNRGVETRESKIPTMSDLRESGQIEQDADAIIFLYREEYYLRMAEPDIADPKRVIWEEKLQTVAGKLDLIAGKVRHGETGKKRIHFIGEFQAVRGAVPYADAQLRRWHNDQA